MSLSVITWNALRIAAGLFFFQHGYQKFFGLAGSGPVEDFVSQRGLGAFIEFFGGLLVALGLQTRLAAVICSGTMAVAFWQFHVFGGALRESGPVGLLPMVNRGELAALYCFVFLFFFANGGGSFSLDHWLATRKRPR